MPRNLAALTCWKTRVRPPELQNGMQQHETLKSVVFKPLETYQNPNNSRTMTRNKYAPISHTLKAQAQSHVRAASKAENMDCPVWWIQLELNMTECLRVRTGSVKTIYKSIWLKHIWRSVFARGASMIYRPQYKIACLTSSKSLKQPMNILI